MAQVNARFWRCALHVNPWSHALQYQGKHQLAATCSALAMLQVTSMLLADGARAEANACEQLKGRLAARIDPSIRGYSLETVPAGAPTPPGAKVIGTCEAGARKLLFRRWSATPPSSGGASAAGPASAPQVIAMPAEQARRSPDVRGDREMQPAPAAASSPTPGPSLPGASASGVDVGRTIDRAATPPAPVQPDKTSAAIVPFRQRASEFLARYWQWIAAPFLLPLAAWLWAWLAHRRAYDEAGLPRGPRLN
jgi:hypothetical protein